MMTEPKYCKNHRTTFHWVPYDQREPEELDDKIQSRRSKKSSVSQSAGSKRPLEPKNKTLNNRSSVHHNIITGGPNIWSHDMKPGLLDKAACNRKKGVAEIRDLMEPNSINRNKDWMRATEKNPDVFKKQNGIFTHLYNAAARFGESKVFKH